MNTRRDPQAGKPQQSVLLVTGLSGAGKTTALQVLEDLGWETIDNFPVRLLKRLLGESPGAPLAIGFDSRTRGFFPREVIALCKQLEARGDLTLTTLFIDCSGGEIERRYNETRRPHPLARDRPIGEGIRAERDLMGPLRRWAEVVIDSSDFSSSELQQRVRELFASNSDTGMAITVSSFGFARGMPPLADLVFDMRFLDNPHWIEGLRSQTGLDTAVAEHIEGNAEFRPAFGKIADLVLALLPLYKAQGRAYLTIAFGCTGGRHRSVYSAECMAALLREQGHAPTVLHHNLSARATDAIEANRGG